MVLEPCRIWRQTLEVACADVVGEIAVRVEPGAKAAAELVETFDGSHWTAAGPSTTAFGTEELAGVSCLSSAFCQTVGYAYGPTPYGTLDIAVVETDTNGSWTATEPVLAVRTPS